MTEADVRQRYRALASVRVRDLTLGELHALMFEYDSLSGRVSELPDEGPSQAVAETIDHMDRVLAAAERAKRERALAESISGHAPDEMKYYKVTHDQDGRRHVEQVAGFGG